MRNLFTPMKRISIVKAKCGERSLQRYITFIDAQSVVCGDNRASLLLQSETRISSPQYGRNLEVLNHSKPEGACERIGFQLDVRPQLGRGCIFLSGHADALPPSSPNFRIACLSILINNFELYLSRSTTVPNP